MNKIGDFPEKRFCFLASSITSLTSVSYTHLDVYKRQILFYLLILLSIFSCKKEEKINSKVEKKTLEKINKDTIFIKEKCAVFISCTQEEIELSLIHI